MRPSGRAGMGIGTLFGAMAVVIALAFGFYLYVEARAAGGRRALTIERMNEIEACLKKYLIDSGGNLPTQRQGLQVLVTRPQEDTLTNKGWNGPYLDDAEKLNDGWGHPIKYYYPGGTISSETSQRRPYDLVSFGRDGQEGGTALDRDICSWDRATMVP